MPPWVAVNSIIPDRAKYTIFLDLKVRKFHFMVYFRPISRKFTMLSNMTYC